MSINFVNNNNLLRTKHRIFSNFLENFRNVKYVVLSLQNVKSGEKKIRKKSPHHSTSVRKIRKNQKKSEKMWDCHFEIRELSPKKLLSSWHGIPLNWIDIGKFIIEKILWEDTSFRFIFVVMWFIFRVTHRLYV